MNLYRMLGGMIKKEKNIMKKTIKLSKSQWKEMGKKAGWMKTANIPAGNTPESQALAQILNNYSVKLTFPESQQKFRSLAADIIRVMDEEVNAQQQQPINPNQQYSMM